MSVVFPTFDEKPLIATTVGRFLSIAIQAFPKPEAKDGRILSGFAA
jgi:hypothetical protein